jgi:hypothetical protein
LVYIITCACAKARDLCHVHNYNNLSTN